MTNQPHTHVIRALSAGLALAVLAGFVVIAALGIHDSVVGTPREYAANLVHVTTGISALVGGVVAAAFGAQVPTSPLHPTSPSIFDEATSHVLERTGRAVGSAYAVTYVVVGVSAVVVWVWRDTRTVEHVSALAATFLGLALIIVAAFFRQPAPRVVAGTAGAAGLVGLVGAAGPDAAGADVPGQRVPSTRS